MFFWNGNGVPSKSEQIKILTRHLERVTLERDEARNDLRVKANLAHDAIHERNQLREENARLERDNAELLSALHGDSALAAVRTALTRRG